MSRKTRLGAAAAGIAAAVALSACSTATGGAPVAVQSSAVAISSSPATEPIRWVNVQDQAPVLPRDTQGMQYGTDAKPGIGFGYRNIGKQSRVCTLGPAVRSSDGRSGFITAGHCTSGKASTPAYLSQTSDALGPQALMGNVESAVDDDAANDSAITWAPAAADASRIAGRWPVAGIMAKADVPNLVQPGDPVCINGARSGVVCSRLISADGYNIRTEAVTQGNDSGAPVFVVAPPGRRSSSVSTAALTATPAWRPSSAPYSTGCTPPSLSAPASKASRARFRW
ncbi:MULTISPECIES: hypothetical protein [unclassified Rhodococcus (in: high G+C Gram-positive bacteria)]|uniref:hypothetical protein n=1 Tax=unclassified Rhodococcus (in: high G+C Gram-positive bacteria) TaxID=192944 RepID=UPI001141FB24|nr:MULTISPECIES: hypothetical protein [unclassified Rhodococcus (in: high G+C Gram-positive bacteria)]TQC40504.1 hypothetical protein EEB16_01895 [Rhodococcus sp. WS7]